MKNEKIKELSNNKKNFRFYETYESYECGLVLNNKLTKLILNYRVSLGGCYGWVKKNEIWLKGLFENEEIKLLLNRWEIDRIIKKVKEKKYLMVPDRMYLRNHRIKINLALVKRINYTNFQKLETIKRKDDKKIKKMNF